MCVICEVDGIPLEQADWIDLEWAKKRPEPVEPRPRVRKAAPSGSGVRRNRGGVIVARGNRPPNAADQHTVGIVQKPDRVSDRRSWRQVRGGSRRTSR